MLDNPAWKNFNPRFGFAYDPFGNHKTSVRGGFGMFHELISVQNYSPAFWAAYPWPITVGIGSPYPIIPNGGLIFQTPSAFPGWDVHVSNTPYVMQYNLNVQHQLASTTVLTIGYVGSHGVHLFTGQEENPPLVCPTAQGPNCKQSELCSWLRRLRARRSGRVPRQRPAGRCTGQPAPRSGARHVPES
jgi:hypothetical protein